MKKKLARTLRRWLGIQEPNWWDRPDAGPAVTIQGPALADALNHRKAVAS